MKIKRLLIANRGEIACRIMRTAHQMGILCAAVYSEADRHARHVQLADAAFCIGAPPSRDSYLNAAHILRAARQWQADAIHPGYGFLSENADFARAVTEAGMIFVGPGHEAIAAMGVKSRAKQLMQSAAVPVLPGYHDSDQSEPALLEAAQQVGYPLLIKAVAGGGGRGLRRVDSAADFSAALAAVQREAASSFGDARVLLERYLPQARHIEVQVFADQQGNYVHLYERDCSIQRRHQKVVEEAPAPGLDEALRQALGEAAVRAARAIRYVGAGTVEFLLADDQFYFMEMNTRLQVEHPVTEAITGQDLVAWQLRVAAGEPLPLSQEQIRPRGWAIELRINAENPLQQFLPGSGRLRRVDWPAGEGIRIDTGVGAGDFIGTHYDAMLAKLIVHGEDREHCLARLQSAVAATGLFGVDTNLLMLQAITAHPAFHAGLLHTTFLDEHWPQLRRHMLQLQSQPHSAIADQTAVGWQGLSGWRNLSHNTFSRRHHLLGLASPVEQVALSDSAAEQDSQLLAPLPGQVVALHVEQGESVVSGQALLTLEAMKMEHTLTASSDAVVEALHCSTGQRVTHEQLLISFSINTEHT